MERLHNPSTNSVFGSLEHIFSLKEIDTITQKIADDEWTALGSVMAESMLEMILEVGENALNQRGWVERMSVINRIAEEVSSAVEKSIYRIRSQPSRGTTFDQEPHHLPDELLSSMQTLLRHELNTLIGGSLDSSSDNTAPTASFQYNARDLSILVISSLSEAIESYCSITNIHAPFFNLVNVMEDKIRSRRRELLVKHCRGYETVDDIVRDIENSRMHWLRDVLGKRAAKNYEFGEVTTKVGNEHSHEKERRGTRRNILNGLLP